MICHQIKLLELNKNFDNTIPSEIRHLKNNNEILTIGYGLITKIDKIMQNYEISKS